MNLTKKRVKRIGAAALGGLGFLGFALAFAHCTVDSSLPAGAFATAPSGAQILSATDYSTLQAAGSLVAADPDQATTEAATFAAQDAANQAIVNAFVQQNPGVPTLQNLIRPYDVTGFPGGVKLANGDFQLTFNDNAGKSRTITTEGNSARLASLASAITVFPTQSNQLALYTSFYNSLPAGFADRLSLPSVSSVGSYTATQLASLNAKIGNSWQTIAGSVITSPSRLRDPGCTLETGYSSAGDTGSGSTYGDGSAEDSINSSNGQLCSNPLPNGLYGNFNFPLKPYLTCIRQQGGRPVCHTFAAVALAETVIARDHAAWVNLSEEDVMARYRLLWKPALYHDTGDTWEILTSAISTGYHFNYEKGWDYNPSYSRVTSSDGIYSGSCLNYPSIEPCSDTSPQPNLVCEHVDTYYTCAYVIPNSVAGTSYSLASSGISQIWDSSNPDRSTQYILLNLAYNNPVALLFNVSPAFMNAQSAGANSGYVLDSAADLAANAVGQHAVVAVGYINNTDGAAQIPGFTPGSGGGYFILKNSWGNCLGDAGYSYISYDYAKATLVEADAMSGLN